MNNLVYSTGDYIAHADQEIIIIWRRTYTLFVYDIEGYLIDKVYDPNIEFLDDVDETASDYVQNYYEVKSL